MSLFDRFSNEILRKIKPIYFADIIEELIEKVPDIKNVQRDSEGIAMAMNQSKYLLSITNRDTGVFEFINKAWEDYSGQNFYYLTSQPFINMVDEEDKDRTLKAWSGMLDNEIEQAHGFINHYFGKRVLWFADVSKVDHKYFIAVAEGID